MGQRTKTPANRHSWAVTGCVSQVRVASNAGRLYDARMARILVVDDDRDFRDSMCSILERHGHEAICVPNGREALIQVLTHVPDVVLLDLHMPEMDGPSFLEVIRSYLRLQSLPVVVVTGLADSPMVDHAQFLKVNAILVKGKASPDEIVRALEESLIRVPG